MKASNINSKLSVSKSIVSNFTNGESSSATGSMSISHYATGSMSISHYATGSMSISH